MAEQNGTHDVKDIPTGLEVDGSGIEVLGGEPLEHQILQELSLDDHPSSTIPDKQLNWSRKYSCLVVVRQYSKASVIQVAKAQREITALLACKDDTVPTLLDYFDPAETIYVVLETKDDLPLKTYIEQYGTLSEDAIKSAVTQLFSALATIFHAGFAHLSINDQTLYMTPDCQLTIKEFHYAHKYSTEKTDELYAGMGDRYGDGIYVAPEVLLSREQYNARKAVLWSCGVAIYYMATGQTERLASLDHPSLARPSTPQIETIPELPAEDTPASPPTPSRRRSSLSAALHRRSPSAANITPTHSRKTSITQPPHLITYPGTRFETPSWARDIISKMLVVNPYKRAELIEVASKVPREVNSKQARPLIELCWLDYKEHVGPYAGLNYDFDDSASISSSMFSGISRLSNPFGNLLGGRRRSEVNAERTGRSYAGFV